MSEADLVRWGRRIGEGIRPPAFLALTGPVGAGKSVLARAIARGAGIEGAVPSPTFNLRFQYDSPRGVRLVHLDLYRIGGPDELLELGWEELGQPDELILVEWPEQAGDRLPLDRWEIDLRPVDEDRSFRTVAIQRWGEPSVLPGFPVELSR